ncbi:cation-translocating P-type ATPase [Pararhodospirillum photometricum]|uniref:Cation-transporting ATPase Pma1, putative n=1 Tax=Pararhodospirillum photometricum DSM 122 TaxID=1150469 RepID=H6SL18_PARPM|nr:cation-translocating P-type ATPase [Pararhodospirillum photometricum]CCG08683.1 Cation-transporting ATPase Pma1, putative [Pararhodospirillum photometricum DSM 122]
MPSGQDDRAIRQGLETSEADRRHREEGDNVLPRPGRRPLLRIWGEVLQEPMLALLLGGGAVYLALGNTRDAVILLTFASVSVLITVVQEARTERVLEALRDLTSPRALVIRGGKRLRVAGREVVRGDSVVLAEGDRVPADAVLVVSDDLQADESLLTGESMPVRKRARIDGEACDALRPGGDDTPGVFSGSLVVRGTGIAVVSAIGPRSEIGKIGQSLNTVAREPPRLRRQTRRLVLLFALGGGAVSLLVVVLYGLLRGSWLDAVLAGIAIGMSMLPEEFPVVLTVFMAMGAWRISQARVLTRRAAAIETLGSATVLCTDKTGTLTQNHMSIVEMRRGDATLRPFAVPSSLEHAPAQPIPEAFWELVTVGCLASAPIPVDPMDRAFHDLARELLPPTGLPPGAGEVLVRQYGLRPSLLAVTHVWQGADPSVPARIASKGAPEAMALLCRLDPTARAALAEAAAALALGGRRVLGVARATIAGPPWPDSPQDLTFQFLGLVGLADPLRPSVPKALQDCRSAGIRVVMITGDSLATAREIARQAGIKADDGLTGDDIAGMTEEALAVRVRTASVFARIMPEQKLRLVLALKADGEIVAMTGDGVNDAPSLKAAHIGIAMGGRGTDVAREASSIVLLDDDFGSIVKSIRLGRRIYDNIRKATGFIFAVHVPIAGMALLPLVFGLPIVFTPMHIAFLEMVIDPVCSLVFEAETEENDVMNRPPRPPTEALFPAAMIWWSIFQGALAFAVVAGLFVMGLRSGMPEAEGRTLAFFSLVLCILVLILVNRSSSASIVSALRRPNPMLLGVIGVVVVMLALTVLSPFVREVFRFHPLSGVDLLIVLGAGVGLLATLDLAKVVRLRMTRRSVP